MGRAIEDKKRLNKTIFRIGRVIDDLDALDGLYQGKSGSFIEKLDEMRDLARDLLGMMSNFD